MITKSEIITFICALASLSGVIFMAPKLMTQQKIQTTNTGDIQSMASNIVSNNYLLSATETGIMFQTIPDLMAPSGTIALWTREFIPNGWALCDGTNGRPDLTNVFPLGWGLSKNSTFPIGATGGFETVKLETQHLPAHSHKITMFKQRACGNNRCSSGSSVSCVDCGSFQSSGSTSSSGGSQPHQNMPPYYVVKFIIKL